MKHKDIIISPTYYSGDWEWMIFDPIFIIFGGIFLLLYFLCIEELSYILPSDALMLAILIVFFLGSGIYAYLTYLLVKGNSFFQTASYILRPKVRIVITDSLVIVKTGWPIYATVYSRKDINSVRIIKDTDSYTSRLWHRINGGGGDKLVLLNNKKKELGKIDLTQYNTTSKSRLAKIL